MRRTALLALACAVAFACGTGPRDAAAPTAAAGAPSPAPQPATRIVSLVPSITETLFAIGAGSQVVGVSSFDKFPPEVEQLPRVGALLDPDTERILGLRPDLVAVYGSQTELEARMQAVGIRAYAYRHGGGIETELETILELGAATGHAGEARRLVAEVRSAIDGVRMRVAGRTRPRTLLVIGRQPGTLQAMYASGGVGFLHELLEAAGGRNVYADVAREAVQPTHEGLLAAAPDVVIEIAADARSADAQAQDRALWTPLGTIPAVRTGRLHFVSGAYLVVPGPRMSLAVQALARLLHPELDWPEAPK